MIQVRPIAVALTACLILLLHLPNNSLGFSPVSSRNLKNTIKNVPLSTNKSIVDEIKGKTATTTTQLGASSFFGKPAPAKVKEPEIIQGIGLEGCQLPSPSRINTYPKPVQAKIVVGIFAALFLGTSLASPLVSELTAQYEWVQSFRYSWPITLGLVYLAAGITHFTVEEEYCNIYPAKGSWGFWYLPGSPEFHVRWTGVAEILGGAGLLLGGLGNSFFLPVYESLPVSHQFLTSAGLLSDSAAALFLLTIAVTPSNIYMYTHGARLPKEGPAVPMTFHAVRGILQIVLLTLLYQMGEGSFNAFLSSSSL